MTDNTKKTTSFLTDDQREGQASKKVDDLGFKSLDEAIDNVSVILNQESADMFRELPEAELPTSNISVYNHELRKLVPAGIGHTLRGNPRTVCGITGSKKISMGKEESLREFYHIRDPKLNTMDDLSEEEIKKVKQAEENAKFFNKKNIPRGKNKNRGTKFTKK